MTSTRKIKNLWLFAFCADFLAIAAAYYTTLIVRFHSQWGGDVFTRTNLLLRVRPTGLLGPDYERFYWVSAPRLILIMTVTLTVIYALRDLYAGRRFIRRRPVAWNVMVANATALVVFYAYFYLRRNTWHPRSMFVTILILNVFYTVVFRWVANGFLRFVRRHSGLDRCRSVLVGQGRDADYLADLFDTRQPHGMSIAYRMRYDPNVPFEDWLKELGKAVSRNGAEIIILAEEELSIDHIMSVLQLAGRLGISVKVMSDKLDVLKDQARIPVDIIRGVPLVHFEAPALESFGTLLRRSMSLLFGFMLLVVMLPVMVLIAVLIKLTSRGPVFFVQERIGVNRRPFRMIKFRTMHERAEEEQAAVEEFNESGGALFKMRKDPRVTLIGRLLRRLSLDELPQLINVVCGEMAVVGPRPLPRRDFESYYEEWHYSRHEGIPGLTCLWQVSGRSDVDFHDMCILDVYYLRNHSWVLDLKIILRTAWVVVFGKGAY